MLANRAVGARGAAAARARAVYRSYIVHVRFIMYRACRARVGRPATLDTRVRRVRHSSTLYVRVANIHTVADGAYVRRARERH